MDFIYLGLLLLSYLLGSISSAVLICRLLTLPDPRIVGSLNPGTTNVLRIGGSKAAIGTLLGDILKTALPLLLALKLNYTAEQVSWLGVCSILGHCFPIYFSFKGGKGVASMLTAIAIILPNLAFLAIGSWLLSFWIVHRASVASLLTALVIPVFVYHFYFPLLLPIAAFSSVVFIRHRRNIQNILQGKEAIINLPKN